MLLFLFLILIGLGVYGYIIIKVITDIISATSEKRKLNTDEIIDIIMAVIMIGIPLFIVFG